MHRPAGPKFMQVRPSGHALPGPHTSWQVPPLLQATAALPVVGTAQSVFCVQGVVQKPLPLPGPLVLRLLQVSPLPVHCRSRAHAV